MHLVWLRNDIRLDDNPALYQAIESCGKAVTQQKVCVVYVATPKQWRSHDESPAKLGFRSQALTDLRQRLAKLGIEFHLLETPQYGGIPKLLAKFCDDNDVTDCWWNEEIPLDEKRRDIAVSELLAKKSVTTHECKCSRIVNHKLLNQQESPYKVFTPWYKAWVKYLQDHIDLPLPEPKAVGKAIKLDASAVVLPGSNDFRSDLWPAKEKDALKRLETFVFEREQSYMQHRDIPSVNGTSTVSPYLASGLISPRRCLAMIMQACGEQKRDWQGNDWLRELAWREFYYYLMQCFPRLCQSRAFKAETENLQWEQSSKALKAWQQGNTGFPIVDAAMRQLNQTGWMHNRLRMVTASFLTKLLLIDWREGEKYFMQNLIDGDFASNNGGWQWSASTGCDASPWFRIFNPYSQSQKFDPEGKFIKKFVPELKDLNSKDVHNPPSKVRSHLQYPEPVVDYKFARERVLARFKELK